MTAAEWQKRFRLVLAAGAFRDEQWRVLASAVVRGDDAVLKSQDAMEKFSLEQVAKGIALMIEANPTLAAAEGSAEFTKMFQISPTADSEPALIRNDMTRETLQSSCTNDRQTR